MALPTVGTSRSLAKNHKRRGFARRVQHDPSGETPLRLLAPTHPSKQELRGPVGRPPTISDNNPKSNDPAKQPKSELPDLLARRLIHRRDVKAQQSTDGAYRPIRSPWTRADLRRHLAGDVTYGHYLVNEAGRCRILAFDIDFDKTVAWSPNTGPSMELSPREIFGTDHPAAGFLNRYVRGLADGLAWRLHRKYPQLLVLVAFSGSKGIHVYGCFGKETSAKAARVVATSVLEGFGCFEPMRGNNFYKHVDQYPSLTVEIFPKQEDVGGGKRLGNLLRLPLGINQKTKRRAFFYRLDAPQEHLIPDDPTVALTLGSLRKERNA